MVYAADCAPPVDAPPIERGAVAGEDGRSAVLRRLAGARTLHPRPGDVRYEKGTTDWLELIDAAPGARARMLAAEPAPLHRLV
jgi:hypothetical protein